MKHRLLSVMLVMALGLSLLSVNALALDLPDLDVLEDVVATVEEAEEEPAVVIEETAPVLESGGDVAINEENFPDDIFRAYVQEEFDDDGDWMLSEEERMTVESIWCQRKGIMSLKGVEHFLNLVELACSGNSLTSLDISSNTKLEGLYCNDNMLGSLDVSNNRQLVDLRCYRNNLRELDVSNCIKLESLFIGNEGEGESESVGNQFTTIDLTQNTALERLDCTDAGIEYLDVSRCGELKSLACAYNNLCSLNVENCANLEGLYCSFNQLASLDVKSNPELIKLDCHGNDLAELDLSANINLEYLDCGRNLLEKIDISNNAELEILYCYKNNLASLDIRNNPYLIEAVVKGTVEQRYGMTSYTKYVEDEWGGMPMPEKLLEVDSDVTLIDGIPDAAELTALMKHIVGEEELAGAMAYDYNNDGVVDILDVIRAVRYLSGEEVELN